MESIMSKLSNPKDTIFRIVRKMQFLFPSDEAYLRLIYFIKMGGGKLNLQNPRTFSEKIQWLKLYNRNPEYHKMVEKYDAKIFAMSRIGEEYIIPTYGVWNKASDIEWNNLPSQFVLKATHSGGGGGLFICKDKESFDKEMAVKSLNIFLNKADLYKGNIEWAYKDIPHRVIAEALIVDDENQELKDYKFFCFNGEVKFFKVDFGRFVEHHANYYDVNWNLLPFGEPSLPPVPDHFEEKPQNFEKMIELAQKLSAGIPFIRVDLYNVRGKIYFGELTFYPASGFGPFSPEEYEYKIGEYIKLPK